MVSNSAEQELCSTIEGQGLSESEVADRRRRGLSNVLPVKTSRTYTQILRENVLVPVNVIMFALGLALVVLGQVSDALISVGVAFFNVLVGTVQEVRAKRVLDRISLLTRPKVTVLRGGQEQIVGPDDAVIGDLLVLHPGDQVVVDGRVVSDARLELDESLLSGESEPVVKQQQIGCTRAVSAPAAAPATWQRRSEPQASPASSSCPRDAQRDCIAEEYVRETGKREKMSKSRGRFRQSQWVA